MNTEAMNVHAGTSASLAVSGFFTQREQVDQALSACLGLGIPRDLIDVAISEKAASKFKQLKAKRNTDHWFAWTGRGALIGLLISILLTLGIVMLKGYEISDSMALVQLLGPDIGIIVGAAIGAIYGWMIESDNNVLMQRADEREDAMLFLVYLQPQEEAEKIRQILADHGAESIVVENTSDQFTQSR
jgi:hypothetical protein